MITTTIVSIILLALFASWFFYRKIKTRDLPKPKVDKLTDMVTADDLAKCRKFIKVNNATFDQLMQFARKNCASYPSMVGNMLDIYKSMKGKK